MGSFTASLRAIGDVRALKATVELADGRLSIVAGSNEIGSWSFDEIKLEQIPTGYRMAAEGEQILIEFQDVDSFAAELATQGKKKRRLAVKSPGKPKKAKTEEITPTPEVASLPVDRPNPVTKTAMVTEKEAPRRPPKRPEVQGVGQKGIALVDRVLATAQKRFGPYLPDWVFSRAMFFIAVVTLVTMFLLPGVFSIVLLIAGALTVLFGAVAYSDTVLASKWLPGRATPIQALLLGLTVLMLGVLLGMIAK